MDLTRRKVLTLGALTAASAAIPLNAIAGITGAPLNITPSRLAANDYDSLSRMTAETFKPWVGSVFDVHSASPRPALVILDEVQDPPTLPKSPKNSATAKSATPASVQTTSGANMKGFALRFKNLSGEPFSQGTYIFENGGLGRFALFVVPSGKDAQPMYYTGLVNRLVQ